MLIFPNKRFAELNDYDIDRALKQGIEDLEQKNFAMLSMIQTDTTSPAEVVSDFATQVEYNSAETLYEISMTQHLEFVYNYFEDSPLFRRGRQEIIDD